MERINEPMRWPLPQVVHPTGSLCFQINVPNEPAYIGAFYGAIWALTYSRNWQRDPAHQAAEVSRVWSKIFFDLRPGGCSPPAPPFGHGIEQEDFMPLRVDCDCNVFVTCCDGTEKQILTADQVNQLLVNGGAGTPQPQPGGGCQIYHMSVPAGAVGQLIPTVVNSGDTIELSNLAGAWYGGSVTWYCPDGFVFFAGCTGATNLSGGSQMPSVPIGRVIALINGTYYDIQGSTFTVPGGVSNQQVTLLMNTDTVSTASGSVTLDAQVCNNQAATWAHTFNMALSNHGWVVRDLGIYVPGSGFDSTFTPTTRSGDIQFINGTAFTLNRLAYVANDTPGSGSSLVGIGRNSPGSYIVTPAIVSGVHLYDTGPISLSGTTNLYIDNIIGSGSSDPGGSGLITSVIVEGSGFDPFVGL